MKQTIVVMGTPISRHVQTMTLTMGMTRAIAASLAEDGNRWL